MQHRRQLRALRQHGIEFSSIILNLGAFCPLEKKHLFLKTTLMFEILTIHNPNHKTNVELNKSQIIFHVNMKIQSRSPRASKPLAGQKVHKPVSVSVSFLICPLRTTHNHRNAERGTWNAELGTWNAELGTINQKPPSFAEAMEGI